MKRSLGRMALVVAALSLPVSAPAFAGDAPAPAAGEDEVTLKNGGMVRGTVVGLEPGTKVVIQEVGAAAPRTIPWGEVADVERGKYKATGAVEPGETSAGYDVPEPAPVGGPGVVKLHVSSSKPVQVIEHLGTSYAQAGAYAVAVEHSQAVCGTPCDKVIDGSRGQQFIVTGDGVPPSETFVLSDREGDTTVHVDPGSTAMVSGGAWMGGTGILGMLTGGTFLAVGLAIDDSTGTADDLALAGGITLAASTALLGGGIALLIAGDTDVEIESTPRQTGATRPTRVAPRYWRGEF